MRDPYQIFKMHGLMSARMSATVLLKKASNAITVKWSSLWNRPMKWWTKEFLRRLISRFVRSVSNFSNQKLSDKRSPIMNECSERAYREAARSLKLSSSSSAKPKLVNSSNQRSKKCEKSYITTFTNPWTWSRKKSMWSSKSFKLTGQNLQDQVRSFLK